jgi:hypothetical protein
MTDLDAFESRLRARLQAHSAVAVRPSDAAAITRVAIAGVGRQGQGPVGRLVEGWTGLVQARSGASEAMAMVLLVALLVAIVAASSVLVGSLLPTPHLAIGNTFQPTGELTIARSEHIAIRLPDGRVLVLGGATGPTTGYAPVALSEVYDPTRGDFTTMDAVPTGLDYGLGKPPFSATLLADGRVLVAGGLLSGGLGYPKVSDLAFVLDPASGRISPTGRMTVARFGHAAIRLSDGRVLISGGQGIENNQRSLASAELYDPQTGRFSPTGSMTTERGGSWFDGDLRFDAIGLADGRVLVRGGAHGDATGAQGVAEPDELYDPATGNFASILDSRPVDGATSLILTLPNAVYRYDLATGTAVYITPQPADLVRAFGERCALLPSDCLGGRTTTLLADGRVLLAGGTAYQLEPPGSQNKTRVVALTFGEVLDPDSGAVTPTRRMIAPRVGHTATLLADGRVLLIGGQTPITDEATERPLFSAEIYVPD